MKTKRFRISVLLAALFLATGLVAEAQVGKLMQRAKKAVTEKTNMSADNVSGRTIAAKGNALYVSMETWQSGSWMDSDKREICQPRRWME